MNNKAFKLYLLKRDHSPQSDFPPPSQTTIATLECSQTFDNLIELLLIEQIMHYTEETKHYFCKDLLS